MSNTHDAFNAKFLELIENLPTDLESEETAAAMKNFKTFTECRPPETTPEPDSCPEPTTFWGKRKVELARVWESETTRTVIKAGGTFAGVALVAYSTIYKDHVLERQALAQANTSKPS